MMATGAWIVVSNTTGGEAQLHCEWVGCGWIRSIGHNPSAEELHRLAVEHELAHERAAVVAPRLAELHVLPDPPG